MMQGILDSSDGRKKLVLLNTRTPDKECSGDAAAVYRIACAKDFFASSSRMARCVAA
jgi:hypothetical protein